MITKTFQGCVKVKCFGMLTAIVLAGCFGSVYFISPAQASGMVPDGFTRGFSEIVERVQPAVVNVAVRGREAPGFRRLPPGPFGGPPGGGPPMPGLPGRPPGSPGQSAGSGVIISPEGYIVTNNHVVEDASKITVTTFSGKEYTGKIIGADPKTDLAVIKIEGDDLPFVSWSSETLKVGNLVLAVGSPFGLKSSVTMGIISALGRGNVGITEYEDFIQTDAPINPGNSGGPLVNMNGEIVGINTAIFSRTGGSEGIGFAIPVDIVKDITNSLIQTGRVVRGWMGIAIQEMTPALAESFQLPDIHQGGVLISEVHENGPSAKSGLKRGDVILEYRGEKLKDVNHLRHIVARTRVGDGVEVKVLRDGVEETLTVHVGERPSDDFLARNGGSTPLPKVDKLDNVLAGLTVEALTAELKKQFTLPGETAGVVVKDVQAGSAAAEAGLQQGDVIQEINRDVIASLVDYQNIASKIEKESLVVLLLSRRGNNLFVAVNPK